MVALGDTSAQMLSGDTHPASTVGGGGLVSQSSYTRFDQTPIFNDDGGREASESKRGEDPKKNSLNPALNKRIKAPKKIEDMLKQAVFKVKKSLGSLSSSQQPIRSNSQLSQHLA